MVGFEAKAQPFPPAFRPLCGTAHRRRILALPGLPAKQSTVIRRGRMHGSRRAARKLSMASISASRSRRWKQRVTNSATPNPTADRTRSAPSRGVSTLRRFEECPAENGTRHRSERRAAPLAAVRGPDHFWQPAAFRRSKTQRRSARSRRRDRRSCEGPSGRSWRDDPMGGAFRWREPECWYPRDGPLKAQSRW